MARQVIIVGAGIAGLTAALRCAVSAQVTLLTKTSLGHGGSSSLAQGGVAAALGENDSPDLHAADTLRASGGIADARAVALLTHAGLDRVRELIALGTPFDRDARGALALGKEAAHRRHRILHAAGDATGREIMRVLTGAVRAHPNITLFEHAFAADLLTECGQVRGLSCYQLGMRQVLTADAVVLATGGLGQLYAATTNPPDCTGDGLAMAARAGVELVDLEFVQFHPTALAVVGDPKPLLTEALRGEGAFLVNDRGERFIAHPDGELAPRDVVARAIWAELTAGRQVYLDARKAVGTSFPKRFPTVYARCREAGFDPLRDALPVTPAAHYHMGGILVDTCGRTSLPGLWACGEVAATGVHGANRLASNSLLEALVFGARVADDLSTWQSPRQLSQPTQLPAVPAAEAAPGEGMVRRELRERMFASVGLVRQASDLEAALAHVDRLEAQVPRPSGELRNLLTVARLITQAALQRRESRGSHYRRDFPTTDPAYRRRLISVAAPPVSQEVA